jgi:hypothetical protein
VGNSAQLAWKQSFYPVIISICVSLRSYMLDVVAIFAVKLPGLRPGAGRIDETAAGLGPGRPIRLGELP